MQGNAKKLLNDTEKSCLTGMLYMKYSVKELKQHLAEAEDIRMILSERLKENPKDVGVALCLESENEVIKDILQELKLAEREMPPENLDGNRDKFSRVERLSMAAR